MSPVLTPPLSSSSSLFTGDKLCSIEDCSTGTGVYQRHGYIYSSLAGYVLRKNEGGQVRGVAGVGWREEVKAAEAIRHTVWECLCEVIAQPL